MGLAIARVTMHSPLATSATVKPDNMGRRDLLLLVTMRHLRLMSDVMRTVSRWPNVRSGLTFGAAITLPSCPPAVSGPRAGALAAAGPTSTGRGRCLVGIYTPLPRLSTAVISPKSTVSTPDCGLDGPQSRAE